MIKAIIFDLWNTLACNKLKTNPIVELLTVLGLEMKDLRKLEESFMTRKFDTPHDAAKHICSIFGEPDKVKAVANTLTKKREIAFFDDVIPVLKRLKKKYKLALISNTYCFGMESFYACYDKYFDVLAFSFDTGLLKPDNRVFRLVLGKLGVNPEETVIVGDNLKDDIIVAEKLGMAGILIKRDLSKILPSYVERGTHNRTIRSIGELEKFL